jgi:flagellar hook assembly protein FlgD
MRKIIFIIFLLTIFSINFLYNGTTNETIKISKAYSYPNPFDNNKEVTHIKFVLSSDVTNRNGDISVIIYDFNGKKVWSKIEKGVKINPNETKEFIWGGENDLGNKVPKGLYFAKIIIEANNTCYKVIKILIK